MTAQYRRCDDDGDSMPRPAYHKLTRPSPRVEKYLGELETEIMTVLWAGGELTVRDVLARLDRPRAYTTVMTVMNRLVDKGLLRRTPEGGSYRYQAALDRAAFLRRTSQRIVEELVADFGEVAIAHFAATLQDLEPEQLAALARLANAPEVDDHHDR